MDLQLCITDFFEQLWTVLYFFNLESTCPLLVYRNMILCMFILYPTPLLRSLVLGGFFCRVLGTLHLDNPLLSINRDSFISSFLICVCYFLFLPYFSDCNTMLNKSGGTRSPFFVPNFGGRAFSDLGCTELGLISASCSRGSLIASHNWWQPQWCDSHLPQVMGVRFCEKKQTRLCVQIAHL